TRRRRLIQASQPEAPCSAAVNPGSEMDATTEAEEFGFGPGFSPVAGEGSRLHQSRIAEPRRASGTRAAQTANSNPRMKSRQHAAALMGRPPGANSPLERRYAGTRKITAAAASNRPVRQSWRPTPSGTPRNRSVQPSRRVIHARTP